MSELLRRNRFGFHELIKKPTPEELQKWYAETYYQDTPDTGYEQVYSAEEQAFIRNKIEQKYAVLRHLIAIDDPSGLRFLDVGCGEGWSLDLFAAKGWDVSGLDYSEYGCKHQNPAMLSRVTTGDIHHNLRSLVIAARRFDCIWLDNVLEHVLDPMAVLRDIHALLAERGVLMIEVPNDCSAIQQHVFDAGIISKRYWVAPMEHISYFNKDGLLNICAEAGFECRDLMADYPIDFSLFNPLTNFVEDKSTGKACHRQRIAIENFLHSISPEKTNALYRALADLGLGRQVIGFFQRK